MNFQLKYREDTFLQDGGWYVDNKIVICQKNGLDDLGLLPQDYTVRVETEPFDGGTMVRFRNHQVDLEAKSPVHYGEKLIPDSYQGTIVDLVGTEMFYAQFAPVLVNA
jgi:hypothetical protein